LKLKSYPQNQKQKLNKNSRRKSGDFLVNFFSILFFDNFTHLSHHSFQKIEILRYVLI
jgi:hypothetical protein